VSAALETHGLGKRYGRRWALSGCTVEVPAGRVAGLVGPNGGSGPRPAAVAPLARQGLGARSRRLWPSQRMSTSRITHPPVGCM